MKFYASIDSDKKVIDVLQLNTEVIASNFIDVNQFDPAIIGKYYNGSAFVDSLEVVSAPSAAASKDPAQITATEKDAQDITAAVDALKKDEDDFHATANNAALVSSIAQLGATAAQIVSDCQNILTVAATILTHTGNVENLAADIKKTVDRIDGHFVTAAESTTAATTPDPAQTAPTAATGN